MFTYMCSVSSNRQFFILFSFQSCLWSLVFLPIFTPKRILKDNILFLLIIIMFQCWSPLLLLVFNVFHLLGLEHLFAG